MNYQKWINKLTEIEIISMMKKKVYNFLKKKNLKKMIQYNHSSTHSGSVKGI